MVINLLLKLYKILINSNLNAWKWTTYSVKSLISIFGYRLMTSHLPYIAIAGSLSFIAYGVYISKLVFLLVISILIFKNHLFVICLILKLSRRWSSSLISKISNHKGILSQKKSDWVLVVVVLMAEMLK